MKKLFLGVLMAVTAITSPLLMANTNDKNDQQEVINIYFARHGKTLLFAIIECCSGENHVSRW